MYACVWGGEGCNLTKWAIKINILTTYIPILQLRQARSKNIITDIQPIDTVLKYEYERSRILHLQNEPTIGKWFFNATIQHIIKGRQSHFRVNIAFNPIPLSFMTTLFIDEFLITTGVVAAFCVMVRGEVTHPYICRLGEHNSAFQEEHYNM